jgi:hypothetical protein
MGSVIMLLITMDVCKGVSPFIKTDASNGVDNMLGQAHTILLYAKP